MLPEPLSHQVKLMSTRPATATQAEIARAIRALVEAGFTHPRIVYTREGVVIEPGPVPHNRAGASAEEPEEEETFLLLPPRRPARGGA